MTRSCSFPDCHRKHYARDYCHSHYAQLCRGVELKPINPRRQLNRKRCGFEGCDRAHYGHGYCRAHYEQLRRGVELSPIQKRRPEGVKRCGFEGCDRAYHGHGYCRAHYEQLRRGVGLTPIKRQRRWGISLVRDSHGNKRCMKCQLWLPESDFNKSGTSMDGLVSDCRACRSAYHRAWRYRIEEDVLVSMIQAQGGQCLTCDADLSDGYCVDHDHSCCPGGNVPTCGKCVRGLLCDTCNTLLGRLEANVERARRLFEYSGVL